MDDLTEAFSAFAGWLWSAFLGASPETQLIVGLVVAILALIVTARVRMVIVRWQRALGFRSPYY
jgi:hypothetical protein